MIFAAIPAAIWHSAVSDSENYILMIGAACLAIAYIWQKITEHLSGLRKSARQEIAELKADTAVLSQHVTKLLKDAERSKLKADFDARKEAAMENFLRLVCSEAWASIPDDTKKKLHAIMLQVEEISADRARQLYEFDLARIESERRSN